MEPTVKERKSTKTLRYAKRLIGFESTSHLSNRLISKYLEMKLTKHGFVVEKLEYRDPNRTRKVNLVAKKGGGHGGLAYFGHTDVVPAENWFSKKYGPFQPVVARQRLYGRGSCDMKGSVACMLTAAQQFTWDDLQQPLYFVCTGDEEVGFNGAKCVVEESKFYREMVAAGTKGIVGEPTLLDVVHAHKGTCLITATSTGIAAHSSTAEGKNANLAMIPLLAEMKAIHDETEADPKWHNSLFDPPTLSWNIGINDRTEATNVTPAQSICTAYARTMPDIDIEPLLARVRKVADQHQLKLDIVHQGKPFYADPNSTFVQLSLRLVHRPKPRTVCYGTDGGAFTEMDNLIICGPGSIDQAHTNNEWISLEQLKLGTEMYAKMIKNWCCERTTS